MAAMVIKEEIAILKCVVVLVIIAGFILIAGMTKNNFRFLVFG